MINILIIGYDEEISRLLAETIIDKVIYKKIVFNNKQLLLDDGLSIELHSHVRVKKGKDSYKCISVEASMDNFILIESILSDIAMEKGIELHVHHKDINQSYEIKPAGIGSHLLQARFN